MISPRVAVAQAPSTPGRLGANIEQAVELISAAAGAGADLVLLPELFLPGYDPRGIAANPERCVISAGDPRCIKLGRACADHRTAVIVGGAFRIREGIVNAALVISSEGKPIHLYRKVHLWGDERRAFVPGSRPTVVETGGLRVGMSICFDAGFPEHMRALALAGVDLIACPAAFALGEERRRYELYYPIRALENTVYVAVSNAVGEQGGLQMFGDSFLFGPRGNEIGRVKSAIGIATAVIDRGEIERAREDLPYLREVSRPPIEPILITGR